jgi:hypothetical protein
VVWPQNHWDGFSRFGLKTGGDGFSWFGFKIGGFGFSSLGLKTGSYSFVIWVSKSPQRFLSLCLKTKRPMVCRLRYKTDERMKTVWGTRQNLTACFTWKQLGLGFPSLASRLVEAWCGWCTWHHCEGCIELKLKTDGLTRRAASDPSTATLPFSMY